MATKTTNYNFVKQDENEFYDVNVVNQNLDEIDKSIGNVDERVTQYLAQYEYQTATIVGNQIQLLKQSNSNRLLFKLESDLDGSITISTDAGVTSKNLVDIDGAPVTSMEKGFHEIVLTGNFFILRNKGGLSTADLQALITITNEAEVNESVLRTNYINAVNVADENINLPAGATWNDILLQIPNLAAGKLKVKSGTAIPSTTTSQYFTYDNLTRNKITLTVSENLGFDPTFIIAIADDINGAGPTLYKKGGLYTYATYPATVFLCDEFLRAVSAETGYVNSNGFKIPITGGGSDKTYTWFAIE